jgi:hypothetical protein
MSWPEILSILESQWALFQEPGRLEALKDWKRYESREAAIDAMKFDESANRRILDVACLQFASKRNWPSINREQKFWLYARLSEARTLVKFFLIGKRSKGEIVPSPDIEIRDQKLLEYVLVYYWHHIGKNSFLGSVVFDPMGPFDPLADLPEPDFP